MLNTIKEFLVEPGVIKSSAIAAFGWVFQWSNAEHALKAAVLIGTAMIVMNHVLTIVVRRWCPERRGVGQCKLCAMRGSFWCTKGLSKNGE